MEAAGINGYAMRDTLIRSTDAILHKT